MTLKMKGATTLGVFRAVIRAATLAVAVVTLGGCGDGGARQNVADSPEALAPVPSSPARAPSRANAEAGGRNGVGETVGFRSRARLVEHFEKHGREFGDIDMGEYLRRAQALRDAPVARAESGGGVLELVRADGVVSRFDRRSGAFIAFDRDGTIRTFFRPNDGEAYFRRQGRRRPTR